MKHREIDTTRPAEVLLRYSQDWICRNRLPSRSFHLRCGCRPALILGRTSDEWFLSICALHGLDSVTTVGLGIPISESSDALVIRADLAHRQHIMPIVAIAFAVVITWAGLL